MCVFVCVPVCVCVFAGVLVFVTRNCVQFCRVRLGACEFVCRCVYAHVAGRMACVHSIAYTDAVAMCCSTTHLTPSVQGGVVNEPLYAQYL